jgi:hypothetical protein
MRFIEAGEFGYFIGNVNGFMGTDKNDLLVLSTRISAAGCSQVREDLSDAQGNRVLVTYETGYQLLFYTDLDSAETAFAEYLKYSFKQRLKLYGKRNTKDSV